MVCVITYTCNNGITMILKEYLQMHNLTVYNFSTICRLSVPVIYRALNNNNISPRSAKKIFTTTNGEVKYKNIQAFNKDAKNDD